MASWHGRFRAGSMVLHADTSPSQTSDELLKVRVVAQVDDHDSLRESGAAYAVHFTPENGVLRVEHSFC